MHRLKEAVGKRCNLRMGKLTAEEIQSVNNLYLKIRSLEKNAELELQSIEQKKELKLELQKTELQRQRIEENAELERKHVEQKLEHEQQRLEREAQLELQQRRAERRKELERQRKKLEQQCAEKEKEMGELHEYIAKLSKNFIRNDGFCPSEEKLQKQRQELAPHYKNAELLRKYVKKLQDRRKDLTVLIKHLTPETRLDFFKDTINENSQENSQGNSEDRPVGAAKLARMERR